MRASVPVNTCDFDCWLFSSTAISPVEEIAKNLGTGNSRPGATRGVPNLVLKISTGPPSHAAL